MMKIILFIFSLNILTLFLKKLMNLLILNLMFMINLTIILMNQMNSYWMKINYFLGMDYISLNLSILTIWILSISIYSNNNLLNNKFNSIFLNLSIMLTNFLIICFSSINFFFFFIFFEISLIPIILIIMGFGTQNDRIQASLYLLFYTLFGSMPLIIVIMIIYKYMNTLMFNMLTLMNLTMFMESELIYFMLTTAFFIKMPMYLMHLWLPKAHVEAPISGSMILAGIMLKLGSYGLYRTMLISPKFFIMIFYNDLYMAMYGSLLASLICLNQNDLKIIVAYSSVVHMGILMASMMTLTNFGMTGSLMMMIAHGLCSSGMFFLVNLNYERLKSRNILINKNLLNIFPTLSMWWFLIFSSNFSAPPSFNLFSEMFMFISLIQWDLTLILLIFFVSFFSTCYSIFIFAFTQYGKSNLSFFNFKSINCREFLICFLIWTPLNFMFLCLKIFY